MLFQNIMAGLWLFPSCISFLTLARIISVILQNNFLSKPTKCTDNEWYWNKVSSRYNHSTYWKSKNKRQKQSTVSLTDCRGRARLTEPVSRRQCYCTMAIRKHPTSPTAKIHKSTYKLIAYYNLLARFRRLRKLQIWLE